MQRVELTKATMQGWARLDAAQRDKFFEAFVSAALRLDRLQFREWLRKRLRSHPLVAVDPAAIAISDRDMALLLKTLVGEPRQQRQPSTASRHHHHVDHDTARTGDR